MLARASLLMHRLGGAVVASEKGVVVGRLTYREDGDLIDCQRMGVGGKAIPPNVDKVSANLSLNCRCQHPTPSISFENVCTHGYHSHRLQHSLARRCGNSWHQRRRQGWS